MNGQPRRYETLRRCLQVTAAIAMVHVLVVALALFLQSQRLTRLSPLESSALEAMQEELKKRPDDRALRDRLRGYDLLVRRVWFEGQSWHREGLRLLAMGLFVALGALLAARALRGRQALPPEDRVPAAPDPGGEVRVVAVMAGVSLLAALAVLQMVPASGPGEGEGRKERQEEKQEETKGGLRPQQANWPNFRGPQATGRALDRKAVTGWDVATKKGLRWKVPVPLPGFSSPIVWDEQVFLTGGDEKRRVLFSFDAHTGALRWEADTAAIPGSPARLPDVTGDTGFAASTPATDGRRVFAVFATGNLICCDMEGRRLWARALGLPALNYGYASSLLCAGEGLVVQVDADEEQKLLCLEGATGRVLWEARRNTKSSWSSPAHLTLDGRELVVVATSRHVEAFDLATGQALWSVACLRGEMAPSPTFDGKTVYVAGDSAYAAAIDAATGKLLWKNGGAVLPDVSSPVVFGKELYLFASGGTLSCLETAKGEILWEKDLPQGWYGSPLALSDAILAFDRKGKMIVLRPDGTKLDLLAEGDLGEGVDTTPALVGNRMFVRGRSHLFCLEGGSR